MAIILSQDHPAYLRLKSKGISVRAEAANADCRNDANVITLGFVNLMPETYLEETVDLLLGRLSRTPRDIRPVFISPEGKSNKGLSWADAQKQNIDSLLITGYAASNLAFEELDFWPALQTIIRDAEKLSLPLLAVCAGAMAVAYQSYQIRKEQAPHKLLGNYEYKTRGGEDIYLATSRNNTLNRRDLLAAVESKGLTIPLQTYDTPQPEPGIIVDKSRNWILTLAHLEYAYTTSDSYPDFEGQPLHILDYQYRRDHNTDSPKYDPELALRVLPPVNLELTSEQVKGREDYAVKLLSDWVVRTKVPQYVAALASDRESSPRYRAYAGRPNLF